MPDKLGELPDIDIESQHVFETSDVESSDSNNIDNLSSRRSSSVSDIVSNDIITSKVKNVLTEDLIVTQVGQCDFSGNISSKVNGTGYQVSKIKETRERKISRISSELQELLETSQAECLEESVNLGTLISLLETLIKDTKHSDTNAYKYRLRDIFERTSDIINKDELSISSSGKSNIGPNTDILEVESRISYLESALGFDSRIELSGMEITENSRRTIQSQLCDLSRRVNLVYNPDYSIEKLESRLSSIRTEAERLSTEMKMVELTNPGVTAKKEENERNIRKDEQVDELIRILPNLHEFSGYVPKLLARMKALHRVHSDLCSSVQLSQSIEQILADMKKDITKWDLSISDLTKKIDEYNENFEENKSQISQWISKLSFDIEKLSTKID